MSAFLTRICRQGWRRCRNVESTPTKKAPGRLTWGFFVGIWRCIIFTAQVGEQSIEARYESETAWLSQKLMAELFAVDVRTINEHLKNIFETGELQREATIRKFRIVQTEGSREVSRSV